MRDMREILEELFKLSEEVYEHPSHAYTDSSVQWDDLCDEASWYQRHFIEICAIIQELKERV